MDILSKDPFEWFSRWYAEMESSGQPEPSAMALATATRDGMPSIRMVLFKGLKDGSFRFFTNYESLKAQNLAENPQAALLFYWHGKPVRQIRIEGEAKKLTPNESDTYWNLRPTESRISAISSPQSSVVASREWLEAEVKKNEKKYESGVIPRPANWGGYGLVPIAFEFWESHPHRLHRRIRFERAESAWKITVLGP